MNYKNGLSAYQLKLIAIIAMFIDHIAWTFVPRSSVLSFIMHLIGRLTAPIMCYFIAEGYHHTHNLKRYVIRLAIFAAVSYIPFILLESGGLPNTQTAWRLNVIYTLLIGLLALIVQDKIKNKILSCIFTILLCILAIPGDWMFFGVFFILAFGKNYGNFKKQKKWFIISGLSMVSIIGIQYILVFIWYLTGTLQKMLENGIINRVPSIWEFTVDVGMQCGVFLTIPLLKWYNGQRGGGKYSKWLFYIFYPLHLLLLAGIRTWFSIS